MSIQSDLAAYAKLSDDELLAELGIDLAPDEENEQSARDERIIAGFAEIQRFYAAYGRRPLNQEGGDIFERLYATRLARLTALPEAKALLAALDSQGLLDAASEARDAPPNALSDAALLTELGLANDPIEADANPIAALQHVRGFTQRQTAEEIARRAPCADFARFKPLFDEVAASLRQGLRQTRPFARDATIETGHYFILDGLLVYVAETGETIKAPNGEADARLRVIFANGAESNLLRRSLQRALYKDGASRRITDPDAGPLFQSQWEEGDIASGTIYVLRSLSEHPFIAQHRELIHKIGVTSGAVETRIAQAEHDATYLLAKVEVVQTYKLAGVNRHKLENLFHRFFAAAQLDLTLTDRFGHPVRPREWFVLPLHVIDEAITRIGDGSITDWVYDRQSAQLVRRSAEASKN